MTAVPSPRALPPLSRATAPVRLDFAGGWTDVPPFATREGGAVVNAALTLRVSAEFEPAREGLLLRAEELNQAAVIRTPADLAPAGVLDLHRAAARMFPPGPGTLRTRSSVPAGSGLGSSGALDVALVAALAPHRGDALDPAEIAAQACHLEMVEAGMAGGRQDQYAAALGGFNFLEFHDGDVVATPLTLDPAFLAELERRTVICYTGRSRVSGETISRVMGAYERGDAGVTRALRELVTITARMREALVAADLAGVAALLSENWRRQQALDPVMCTPEMATLERAMSAAGALGGKAAGAGAGGCMFFIMGGKADAGLAAAREAGATVLEAGWSATGVERC